LNCCTTWPVRSYSCSGPNLTLMSSWVKRTASAYTPVSSHGNTGLSQLKNARGWRAYGSELSVRV